MICDTRENVYFAERREGLKVYTARAIAEIIGVSERRVRQLCDEGIISEHKGARGLFEPKSTIKAYIDYLRGSAKKGENGVLSYGEERALLIRTKRKNEEYELALKEKQLISAEDVRNVLTTMLINFKNRLSGIPSKLSPVISKINDEAEIYDVLYAAVTEALEELSDFETAFPDKNEKECESTDE